MGAAHGRRCAQHARVAPTHLCLQLLRRLVLCRAAGAVLLLGGLALQLALQPLALSLVRMAEVQAAL